MSYLLTCDYFNRLHHECGYWKTLGTFSLLSFILTFVLNYFRSYELILILQCLLIDKIYIVLLCHSICDHTIFLFFKSVLGLINCVCISVLYACMYVNHGHIWCSWRSEEVVIFSGVSDHWATMWLVGAKPGSLQEQLVFFIYWPILASLSP